MESAETGKQHHVAWADRIGLNKVWAKNILDCNENYGTPIYVSSVKCLHNSLINIKNGPQLKTIVDKFVNGDLDKIKEDLFDDWKDQNPTLLSNRGKVQSIKNDISYKSFEMLYNYIVQTLEDNGFGFYESKDVPRGKDGYSQDHDYDVE